MSHFAELDAAILGELAAGSLGNMILCERLREQSIALAKPDRFGIRVGWRVIDRRLQALRKAGKIKIDRKTGWSLA